jgi:hypothetical protein
LNTTDFQGDWLSGCKRGEKREKQQGKNENNTGFLAKQEYQPLLKTYLCNYILISLYKCFSDKMRWKALLAVLLVLTIVGLLFFTKSGQDYVDFFRVRVGQFVSGIFRWESGEKFTMVLTTSKEQFAGIKFKVENSSLGILGNYFLIKIGDQTVDLKDKKTVDFSTGLFSGNVEFTAGSNLKISGESNSFEIEGMKYSSEKPVKIEMLIEPTKFLLTNLFLDKISFSSLKGEVQRVADGKTDSVNLGGEKVEISNFEGFMGFSEEKMTLSGFASAVKGESFSFN